MKSILAVATIVLGLSSLAQAQRYDNGQRDNRGQRDQRAPQSQRYDRGGYGDPKDQGNGYGDQNDNRDQYNNGGQYDRGPYGQWNGEQNYLKCNSDVRRAVYNGSVRSGYDHYIQYGQYENRIIDGRCEAYDAPGWFNDSCYLRNNPDVAAAVRKGDLRSGWHHYVLYGRTEGRNFSCR